MFVDILQHRPGGIGCIGNMQLSPGHLVDKPAIHGSKTYLTLGGTLSQPRNMFKQPLQLRCREIGIDHQLCAAANCGSKALYHKTLALWRATPTLPDDGIVYRQPGRPFPQQSGFSLISNADGLDVMYGYCRLLSRPLGNMSLRGPDVHRVVFKPTGL
jgi:hypothetical protein